MFQLRSVPGLLLPLAFLLGPAFPAPFQDEGSPVGPPAFVPLESPAVDSQLRAAADLAKEGRTAEAAVAYQAIVDGPLWDRVAPLPADPDTMEQARERALREVAARPALRDAWRTRFEETASRLASDASSLRQAFDRFPLADAGSRAGLSLARDAHRRGDPGEALGILDRLADLLPPGSPGAPEPATLLALQGSAAAAEGDGPLLDQVVAAAALHADAPAAGGLTLAAFLEKRRTAMAPAGPSGPRGPLELRWSWSPEEAGRSDSEVDGLAPAYSTDLPPHADHLVAVREGVVYWSDPSRVIAIDLATGDLRGSSFPLARNPADSLPGKRHFGETFAPAADALGVVAALDWDNGDRRRGTLQAFDGSLRCLVCRGGAGDMEHPEMALRWVFHGRPLLLGDRVYVAATETPRPNSPGDVRTHLLCFRRSDLAPIWDAFLSYGSGIHISDVAPAGSPVHRHGRLYMATHTGLQVCVEARTGALLWAHRYRTPESAVVPRLAMRADRTTTPVAWYECPPALSGDLVAFAPRDSYYIEVLRQRPLPGSGRLRVETLVRPPLDTAALTTLWALAGPPGMFFLAGQASGPMEAPLLLRDLDPAAESQVPWRGPVMEPTVVGLPVRTRDAVYLATAKAIYRIPWPGKDGAVEVLVSLAPPDPEDPLPSPGNLVVLEDAVLSVSDDGILCFGPVRGK